MDSAAPRWSVVTAGILGVASGAYIALQKLGIAAKCFSCQDTSALWYSTFLHIALVAGSIAVIVCEFQSDFKVRRLLGAALGVSAFAAFGLLAVTRTLCLSCLFAQATWLYVAIANIPRRGFRLAGNIAFACSMFLLYDAWTILGHPEGSPIGPRLRPYENLAGSVPKGIVLFSDPTCGHCRDLERSLAKTNFPFPILHRWYVPSERKAESTRLAATIESVLEREPEKGSLFRQLAMSQPETPTIDTLQALASSLKVDPSRIKDLMEQPEPSSLQSIASDAELAGQLGVSHSHTLGIVTTLMQSGQDPSVRIADERDFRDLQKYSLPAVAKDLDVFLAFFKRTRTNHAL